MQAFGGARPQNGSREVSERTNSRQSRSQRVPAAVGENLNFANFDQYAPPVLAGGGGAPLLQREVNTEEEVPLISSDAGILKASDFQ